MGFGLPLLALCIGKSFLWEECFRRLWLRSGGATSLKWLLYIPVFFWAMIKANFDVAYRVIHPRMPINPGVVMINTDLKSDSGKLALANSITLTPGTLTMDVEGDKLLIHWINVKTSDTKEATKIIGNRFERFLKVIFS